jgi:uncharacterized protein YaaQ
VARRENEVNIVLGFGKTEEDFEQQELDFVGRWLQDHSETTSPVSIDSQLVDGLKDALRARADNYQKLQEQYKDATEHPDRYSYYWFTVLNGSSDICVVFKFHHVNRSHPLSPDGWGLMTSKRVFHADAWDMKP